MMIDWVIFFIVHESSKRVPNSNTPDFQPFIKSMSALLSVFDTALFEIKNGCTPGGKIKPLEQSQKGASCMENGGWQY